ncbi:MAG: NADH-quinone oxidoreductase subunit I [Candidatus Abyssobacteria bacterium SURF_5]|uniref:NADH-quinone oxidoreductase subunit I n=1 Tax=Abyssobacteria bacterium (strain SURF_5) TaxID=2093360 RepID=A0A3A4NTG5_ABYX5|nr:MAG: NADH-quinone oxidoreductase subunit I [Candidatus Abyssubacteria bacterium SURF_5]
MASSIKTKLNFLERLYFPEIFRGVYITSRHFFKNLSNPFKNPVTIEYPDKNRPISPRWRGRHRLMQRQDGSSRCVACMCCATVCPARCITIEPGEHPDPGVMKQPISFDIDYTRCVFCGFCVEACPVDAIRMDSGVISLVEYSRSSLQLNKEKLLELGNR